MDEERAYRRERHKLREESVRDTVRLQAGRDEGSFTPAVGTHPMLDQSLDFDTWT